jgi:Cdc6-like AAA superfamily ATPase
VARLLPEDVFTPAAPAVDSKVYAGRIIPASLLTNILREKGTQILVYGDSAIGKTSFVLTELRRRNVNHLRVQCESRMKWGQITNEILRQLKEGMPRRKVETDTTEGGVSLNLYFAKVKGGGSSADTIEIDLAGDVGSIGHITDVLSKHQMNLIIDDFEKVSSRQTKTSVANLAKNISDAARSRNSPRIIVLGIADSADDLIEADQSIASRLHPLQLPRMEDEEIAAIVSKGFAQLDISCAATVIRSLSQILGGYPKYAHAIGLEMSRGVLEDNSASVTDANMRRGIRAFLRRYGTHVQAIYNKATVIRGKDNPSYSLVIKALADKGVVGDFTIDEAVARIASYANSQSPSARQGVQMSKKELRRILDRLCRKERGPMFARSSRTGRYYFHNPLSPICLMLGEVAVGP